MRSTADVGSVEMSEKPLVEMPRRLPLTNTRVRVAPRLRRLMNVPPAFSPADNGDARLIGGVPTALMFCRMSETDWKPCLSMSARVMVRTGFSVSSWT